MTERRRGALARSTDRFALGRSAMHWDGTALTVEINERAVPHLTPIRGTVRLWPEAVTQYRAELAPGHHWRPYAPVARIEVALDRPALQWQGAGYFDSNWGSSPLEADFRRWDWMRAELGRETAIHYDTEPRNGPKRSLSLRFDKDGTVREGPLPPLTTLPKGIWRVHREARSEGEARLLRACEDAPFYARSVIETRLDGRAVRAVHETFDGDRLARGIVRAMLPFRMPRTLR